jgi:hypothetical protein
VRFKAVVASIIIGTVLAATPANATHDTIYSPCSTEYGYIHMTYDEWAAHITTMEADGTIPPGMVFRYYEELHGGKGGTVLEDGSIPAWDTWAYHLTDGTILSISDWANGDHPEIEELMFASGKVPEWILDANMVIRRFNDPYWAAANPMTPSWSVWQSLCMGDYGYSIPVMEINEDGVWESNIPTTTTIAIVPTTTLPPDPQPGPEGESPQPPPTTTTLDSSTVEGPENTITEDQDVPSSPPPIVSPDSPSLLDDYDLFDAEWEGYPFEQTILLLEERYPPGTPDKYHFRLSVAVEFLRNGGMVKGLDNLWDYGS